MNCWAERKWLPVSFTAIGECLLIQIVSDFDVCNFSKV